MTVAAAASTASPVSPASALQPGPAAAGPGAGTADADTGFADALQQARQGAARSREAAAQNKTSAREAPKDRSATTREPVSTDKTAGEAAEASPSDVSPAAARSRASTTDETDADLPPWLAQALSRQPAAADDAGALDSGRHAIASQLATAASAAADRDGSAAADAGDDKTRPTTGLEPTAARPAARTAASGVASAAAEAMDHAETRGEQAAHASADAGVPAAATPQPLPQTLAIAPSGPGFTLVPAGDAAVVERPIAAPVASPAFAPALGAELTLMVKEGVSEARLHLNPAEMGPITVQIVVEGQTARVEMAADHAATRQALEQAMPALAGALREDGLTLTGGGVFEQARQPRQGGEGQASPRAGQPTATGPAAAGVDEAATGSAGQRPSTLRHGGVDLYA